MDRQELIDIISDAIGDSMDVDWNYSTGARYVLEALIKEGVVTLAEDAASLVTLAPVLAAIPTTCVETIGGDPNTANRLSFQIKVF